MKLLLGPDNLQTELEFEIFKKIGKFTTTAGRIGVINKVGVYASGGLDSTALLCLILSELQNINRHDIPVICFTIKKSDGPTYYATRLIKKVEEQFGVSLQHVNNITNDYLPDQKGNIGSGPIKFIKQYVPNMVVYMGINRTAPDDVRPFSERLEINYGLSIHTPSYSAPFLFMHKPQILDILYQLGCDDLIPYTHSCTVQEIGACGKCYSCLERQWGFDALGKIDPGTIPVTF